MLDSLVAMRNNEPMNNTNTFASLLNITNDNGLIRGTLGSLKKAVAVMGFDCSTRYEGEATFVTVTHDGAIVARMCATAGEAAMVWTSV